MLIEPIVASEGGGGRLGNYADPAAARFSSRMRASQMATTILVAPEYASRVAGTLDAGYDLRARGPQSLVLIASSAAGYTSVPLVSTSAPGVSFAGSILPLPMMCMTGTPRANR